MIGSILVLSFVSAERLFELWLARRNTALLLKSGAVEFAAGHYPLIVLLHTLWLAGMWLLAWNSPIHVGWLLVFAALQVLRLWVLATLGRRWTTRIIVLPGAPLVDTGPYRFLSHPNYVVVIGEIAVLPLTFGLPLFALLFSAANALLLMKRIREESAALVRYASSASRGALKSTQN